MKIGIERLFRASSRLLVRRQRSYVTHIVTADSAEFSGHGINTTIDVTVRTDPGKSWNLKIQIFQAWKVMENNEMIAALLTRVRFWPLHTSLSTVRLGSIC